MSTKFVCISDTHRKHFDLKMPEGDILLCAGDISSQGEVNTLASLNHWASTLPYKHKVLISGNHDFIFQDNPDLAKSLIPNWIYLKDEAVFLEGFKIYGSPWQPWFYDWAFNLHRGDPIREKWKLIPKDTDILITHGPPMGIMDEVQRWNSSACGPDIEHVGCADLLDKVREIKPKLHVFGHIHEGYGEMAKEGTIFVNASSCNRQYRPVNAPIVVEL